MKHLKPVLIFLYVTVIVVMAAATIVEKYKGTAHVGEYWYGSWWFSDGQHPSYKVGWYSGKQYFPHFLNKNNFDYFKLGPYLAHLGCLKDKTTNQRLYKKTAPGVFEDITSRFWKK